MYDHFSELVWKIDIVFLVVACVLLAFILLSGGVRGYYQNRRIKKLRAIKEAVCRLVYMQSGDVSGGEAFIKNNIPAQTFLDVATNRLREVVFFNQAEQDLFEKTFCSRKNIAMLKHRARKCLSKWDRIEAILALGYAGMDSALEIIKINLFNEDEDTSYFAALGLCQMRSVGSARALLEYLKKNSDCRYKIASMLGQFPGDISSELIRLTRDRDPSLRALALRIMESKGGAGEIDAIEQLVKDESVDVRAAACQCLGVVGNKNTAEVVKCYLKDDSWYVRAQALLAVDNLLGGECGELIIDMIKDNSWLVIDSLKTVLAKHINVAIEYLEKVFAQEDMLAKRIAVEIIEVSGYTEKLYAGLLMGGARKEKAVLILEGMIKAGAYNGLDLTVYGFNEDDNRQIVTSLKEIDHDIAGRLENDVESKRKQV